jgi:tRNA dimethylallyltransferase
MPAPLLVVVLGPTAVGKTPVAIQLARHFKTEIISADSRQLFRELPVGTAAPSKEEMQGVPHHFIGNLSVTQRCDAGQWAQQARAVLDGLFRTHDIVICAGGSGLYIDALLNGMDELPERDDYLRKELQLLFEEKGIAALQEKLQTLDPEYYAEVDIHNHKRLIRAIEVCLLSGEKYSGKRSGKAAELPFRVLKIGLEMDREKLYARINRRVQQMMDNGLEQEARAVLPFRDHNALATVGYRELFDYFDGKISLEKAVELIRQHSRNYAKRQMTWWRRDASIKWFAPDNIEPIISCIQDVKAG